MIAAVAVWEMDVTAGFLHHSFNRQAAFADDVRMVGVTNVQLHGHSITLLKIKLQDSSCIDISYLQFFIANFESLFQFNFQLFSIPFTPRN